MTRLLRRYVACLADVGRVRIASVVALIVVCSLVDGAGIAVLVAVLQVVGLDLQNQGAMDEIAATMTSALAAFGIKPALAPLLLVYVGAVGICSLLGRAQSVAIFIVEQKFVLALRQRLYRAIANANWLFLCRSRSTDFVQGLTEEAGRLGEATFVLLTLAGDLIVSAVYVAFAFALSPTITAMVLAIGALLLIVFHRMLRTLHDEGSEVSDAFKALYAATIEQTQSLKAVKAYSAQERTNALFGGAARRLARAYWAISRRQAMVGSSFEIGTTIALAAMLYVAAAVMQLPAAVILTLLLLFSRLMPRFMSAHQHLRNFVSTLPAFGTVADLIERCEQAGEPAGTPGQAPALRRALRFERVSFGYGDDKATVEDIDLTIEPGTIVALAGPSGAGKSTVADLAMGLLTPRSGRVIVDGTPLTRGNARAWRERIGYVGADTSLFHVSLRANLLWAQPEATDAEMLEALQLAAAKDLVRSLPGKLDAPVGDRGLLLSQGERQRIALARALLRRPRLLIMDEATNGLDAATEALVMQAIRRLRGDMAILLVAHRLSTLRWADIIYVMESGRVTEAGSWDALNHSAGQRFRKLSEAQLRVANAPALDCLDLAAHGG